MSFTLACRHSLYAFGILVCGFLTGYPLHNSLITKARASDWPDYNRPIPSNHAEKLNELLQYMRLSAGLMHGSVEVQIWSMLASVRFTITYQDGPPEKRLFQIQTHQIRVDESGKTPRHTWHATLREQFVDKGADGIIDQAKKAVMAVKGKPVIKTHTYTEPLQEVYETMLDAMITMLRARAPV